MESKISEANNIHGKMKKSTRHRKPYWTEKLTMLCNRMKEARKLYMKRNTDRNKEMMVNTKECFDNERKRLCQEFIIESTKSLNAAESAEFWKKFKAMFANTGEKGVDPLSDDNLGIITENSEIEDKLFDTFFESKPTLKFSEVCKDYFILHHCCSRYIALKNVALAGASVTVTGI